MNKPKKKTNGQAKKVAAKKADAKSDPLITLTIDGKEIKAEAGRNLVDVANENDIFIPSLCYYPEIEPPLGTCRVCTCVKSELKADSKVSKKTKQRPKQAGVKDD